MVAAIPGSYVAKGIALWIATMLPTLMTLVTHNFTINIILLVVIFPLMLSYFSKMAIFASIKTSVIGIAAGATFFIIYGISLAFPRVQDAMSEPGQNRPTTFMVMSLIATVFAISMGVASMAVPMYTVVNNTSQNVLNNIS